MLENYLLEKRKNSTKNGRKVKPTKIQARICELFGISPPTYCAILSNYPKDRTAYDSGKLRDGRSGNKSAKETRIPDTFGVQIRFREFIRGKRAKRERVTATQVLDYLVSANIISVETGGGGVMIPKACATNGICNGVKKRPKMARAAWVANTTMKQSCSLFTRGCWRNLIIRKHQDIIL
ncbi:hypothetical protein IV203_013663 [Nitzschia inconspicua]|uniref:Uncharacterized protein n=1 Tax=Nitzschia inconspicua TaxID=303405 RepID=A0A9K3M6M7_9STRA|nr:hypothetical protein IV203_013663 [Nitzschia inconspicua]